MNASRWKAFLKVVGRRSFGPLLLLAGLVTLAPVIGDIPGVPMLMAILVLLTAGQWLPMRTISQDKLCKALELLRPLARALDHISRPRLILFTKGAGALLIALACVAIAVAMPPMEFVPFGANLAGAALTAFGLALVVHDRLLALIAFGVTSAAFRADCLQFTLGEQAISPVGKPLHSEFDCIRQ